MYVFDLNPQYWHRAPNALEFNFLLDNIHKARTSVLLFTTSCFQPQLSLC